MYRVLHAHVTDPRGILWPADAPMCGARLTGWTCTLGAQHPGPHGAGDGHRVQAVWTDARSTDSWWARLSIWWERRYLGARA